MSRKSKKQAPVVDATAPQAPPPEPPPEEVAIPPAPEETPKPAEPEPVQVVAQQPAVTPEPPAGLKDEELPPPPTDIADRTKKYPPLKTRKPGVGAALKRAGAILGKDLRTMSKHGLVSSIIVFAILLVVFLVLSYTMVTSFQ